MPETVATPFESDAPLSVPVPVEPQRTAVMVSQSQSLWALHALFTRTE